MLSVDKLADLGARFNEVFDLFCLAKEADKRSLFVKPSRATVFARTVTKTNNTKKNKFMFFVFCLSLHNDAVPHCYLVYTWAYTGEARSFFFVCFLQHHMQKSSYPHP